MRNTTTTLTVTHKPTGRKAVVAKFNPKQNKLGLILNHIANRNNWCIADLKLKHIVNSN